MQSSDTVASEGKPQPHLQSLMAVDPGGGLERG